MYQVIIFNSHSDAVVVKFGEMIKRQAFDFETDIATYLSDDYYTDVVEVL